jgi:flavin-binding protein dodecin
MRGNVYKITEAVGSSSKSQDCAIRGAIKRTAQTVDHMQWFEVTECRGVIENGDVAYWQVKVQIGYRLKD